MSSTNNSTAPATMKIEEIMEQIGFFKDIFYEFQEHDKEAGRSINPLRIGIEIPVWVDVSVRDIPTTLPLKIVVRIKDEAILDFNLMTTLQISPRLPTLLLTFPERVDTLASQFNAHGNSETYLYFGPVPQGSSVTSQGGMDELAELLPGLDRTNDQTHNTYIHCTYGFFTQFYGTHQGIALTTPWNMVRCDQGGRLVQYFDNVEDILTPISNSSKRHLQLDIILADLLRLPDIRTFFAPGTCCP